MKKTRKDKNKEFLGWFRRYKYGLLIAIIILIILFPIINFLGITDTILIQVSAVTGVHYLCEAVGEDWTDICYGVYLHFHNKPELCDQKFSKGDRNDCFLDLAVNYDSPELCKEIEGRYGVASKDRCLAFIARDRKDPSLCEESGCFIILYDLTLDSSLCEYAGENQDFCYYKVARNEKELDFCLNLTEKNKQECIIGIAEVTQNSSLCEMISDKYRMFGCYITVVMRNGDVGACENIEKNVPSWYGSCISHAGNVLKDKGVCDRIEDEYSRERCYKDVPYARKT